MAGFDEGLVELVARGVEIGMSRCQPPATLPDDDRPPLLTAVTAAAQFDNVSDQAIYDWMDTGALPEVRIGRRRWVPRAAIDQLVEAAMRDWAPDEALRRLKAVS